jgi:hypothetical protein
MKPAWKAAMFHNSGYEHCIISFIDLLCNVLLCTEVMEAFPDGSQEQEKLVTAIM